MDLGHRQWLYKLYNHIQRRQMDSQAGLYAFLELCTSVMTRQVPAYGIVVLVCFTFISEMG